MTEQLKELSCPLCGDKMSIRVIKYQNDRNSYQYYCAKCDDDHTGWTTTESDELAIKPIRYDNRTE